MLPSLIVLTVCLGAFPQQEAKPAAAPRPRADRSRPCRTNITP